MMLIRTNIYNVTDNDINYSDDVINDINDNNDINTVIIRGIIMIKIMKIIPYNNYWSSNDDMMIITLTNNYYCTRDKSKD